MLTAWVLIGWSWTTFRVKYGFPKKGNQERVLLCRSVESHPCTKEVLVKNWKGSFKRNCWESMRRSWYSNASPSQSEHCISNTYGIKLNKMDVFFSSEPDLINSSYCYVLFLIQTLGCDKVLGSSKVFDRCGACDGDGTSCIGKRFTYKGFPKPMKG